MVSISLCMIVKNEESILERCLDSLHGLMDEIIIVDTGSTDNTKQVALKYTNQVYDPRFQCLAVGQTDYIQSQWSSDMTSQT